MISGLAPGLRATINFLECMHNIFIMERDVDQSGAVASIECRIPLLVLVTESDNNTRSAFSIKVRVRIALTFADWWSRQKSLGVSRDDHRRIARRMVGHRCSEDNIESCLLRTPADYPHASHCGFHRKGTR